MTYKYVLSVLLLIFSTAGAAFGQESNNTCDDQLRAEGLSAPVRSYLALVDHYLQRRPSQLNAILDAVENSSGFINPLSKNTDSLSGQVGAGLEHLRSKFGSEDWAHLKVKVAEYRQSATAINTSKEVAQSETRFVYEYKTITKYETSLRALSDDNRPVYFKQNGRAFVLVNQSLQTKLFEIKNDQIFFIKDLFIKNLADIESEMLLVENAGRVFIVLTGSVQRSNTVSVMEFKDLELNLISQQLYRDKTYATKVWTKNEKIFVSTMSSKQSALFSVDLSKNYEINQFEIEKNSLDEKVKQIWFNKGDETYVLIHNAMYSSDRTIRIYKFKENESFVKVASINEDATTFPIVFDINGKSYIGLGVEKADATFGFQIYEFEGSNLNFSSAISIEEQINSAVKLTVNKSELILATQKNLYRLNFDGDQISVKFKFGISSNRPVPLEHIEHAGRDFIAYGYSFLIGETHFSTLEISDEEFGKKIGFWWTRSAVVTSTHNDGQKYLLHAYTNELRLTQIFKAFKK